MSDRYYARSASDRTEDWPFWFVADRQQGGLNVTGPLFDQNYSHLAHARQGATLIDREFAVHLAAVSNNLPQDKAV